MYKRTPRPNTPAGAPMPMPILAPVERVGDEGGDESGRVVSVVAGEEIVLVEVGRSENDAGGPLGPGK